MLLTICGRCLWTALVSLLSAQLLFAQNAINQTGFAQTGGQTFPITQEAVVASLGEAGMLVPASGVQLPASLSATVPHPTLVVEKREPAGAHRERIRLSCAESHGCLPFYALIPFSSESGGVASLQGARGFTPQESSSLAPSSKVTTAQLRPGDRATLLLANHFMRISIPVILIDTGRSGSEVRVASLDRKQTYRGLLSTDGTVHGDLP